MNHKEHDRLAWRLASILIKLNQGERLEIEQLAEEYNVHRRTIQRDLNERLNFLALEENNGLYSLDPIHLGKLNFKDIERFAALAGLVGLFPALDSQFLRELFDSRMQETLHIHGTNHEDLKHRLADFRKLQQAITEKRRVQFTYTKDEGEKTVAVQPYRLVNNSGVWYLAAVDGDKPKSYSFSKISALITLDEKFQPRADIQAMLNDEDSIWLNEKKTEVVLKIAPPAALYFKRRKLIAQQVIEKELEDGGLIVSGKFAHPNQILPIVRYWIPHVRIVSPEGWQGEMEEEMKMFLGS